MKKRNIFDLVMLMAIQVVLRAIRSNDKQKQIWVGEE